MTSILAFLKKIVAWLRRLFRPLFWLFEQIRRFLAGLFRPVFGAIRRIIRAIAARVEAVIDRLLDWWNRLFKTGHTTDRVREHRVGANAAPLLATITLAVVAYLLPTGRLLNLGSGRFLASCAIIWAVALVGWLSRCRDDRHGRVANFVQRIARPTGLRRLDQVGLAAAAVVLWTGRRNSQLYPLGIGAAVSYVALLIQRHEPRPGFSAPAPFNPAPTAIPRPASGPGEDPGETEDAGAVIERNLDWSLSVHGTRRRHHCNVNVPVVEAEAAKDAHPASGREEDLVGWVEKGTEPCIVELARDISHQSFEAGYSMYNALCCFVATVQSIPYRSDLETTGHDEYWRTPIETLADGAGDCEDTAILLAALLRRAGFTCALLVLPRHVAVGVQVPQDLLGNFYEHDGTRYYYCETTAAGWTVGELPADVIGRPITVYPIPAWEQP